MNHLVGILVSVGLASASMVQIPYSPGNGKVSGSYEVSMRSGDLAFGTYRSTPDTLKVGPAVTLRFVVQPGPYPTVCGFKPAIGIQFIVGSFGSARQSADTSTAWNQLGAYPVNPVALDSVKGASFEEPHDDTSRPAPGYYFVEAGQSNNCDGSAFSFKPKWNRVIFARWGSGVDYAAKISIQAYRDTSFGMLPYYQVLRSVTVHYVLNTVSTDLAGTPIAVRAARPERHGRRYGAGVVYDLYNPLGVRLVRGAGKYEAAVPGSRRNVP